MLVATDSKEFKRPKLARDSVSGALLHDPGTSNVVVLDNKGFFSQMGVAVSFRDPETYRAKLTAAFAETAKQYRVSVPRNFSSSRHVLERIFMNNYPKAMSFLHKLLSRVEGEIEDVLIDWLILPRDRVPEVFIGGTGAISSALPTREFVARIGQMWSALTAWDYARRVHFPSDLDLRIDHFQGKLSPAWSELVGHYPNMQVVPWGDEVDPFICTADIIAYLTDKTARSRHQKLFREPIEGIWAGRPFSIRTGYFDERDLDKISWTDEKPVRVEELYPRPMTYLQVDSSLMAPQSPEGDEVTYRNYLDTRGFVDAVLWSAQIEGTGFKVLQPREASLVRDGDRLVYMGPEAAKRAVAISQAVSVRIESVRELRDRLRGRGIIC